MTLTQKLIATLSEADTVTLNHNNGQGTLITPAAKVEVASTARGLPMSSTRNLQASATDRYHVISSLANLQFLQVGDTLHILWDIDYHSTKALIEGAHMVDVTVVVVRDDVPVIRLPVATFAVVGTVFSHQ